MIVSYIRNLLINTAEIYADVADRIYPLTLPLDEPLPALVLHETAHQLGPYLSNISRVQVSIQTDSTDTEFGYDIAHRIRANVLTCLNLHSGTDETYRVHEIRHIGDTETIAQDTQSFAIYSVFEAIWTE